MKAYIRSLLCFGIMSCTLQAETSSIKFENEAIRKEVTEILKEQTLTTERVVGDFKVNKRTITWQEADARFRHFMGNRLSEKKPYILIVISEENREKSGGRTLFLLYDKDSYECLTFYKVFDKPRR